MTTKETLQKWANGEMTFEDAYRMLENEMPYGTQTGDDQTPEEWMEMEAFRMGVEFPE